MRHITGTNRTVTDPETGKVYPIPEGAAEGDSGEGQSGGQNTGTQSGNGTGTGSNSGSDGDGDGQDDGQGAGSKQAVLADLAKERKARQKLERDLAEITKKHESDQERAIREAAEKARAEALEELGGERLNDKIEVAAAKQLNDPKDAVRLIDRDGLDPADPNLDKEITSRIKALVESKPYLAVQPAGSGSSDAGSKSATPASGDMNSLIRQAAGRG